MCFVCSINSSDIDLLLRAPLETIEKLYKGHSTTLTDLHCVCEQPLSLKSAQFAFDLEEDSRSWECTGLLLFTCDGSSKLITMLGAIGGFSLSL